MATPNRTRFAILGFLTLGPMSGYDIKKLIEVSVVNFWSESFGQLYPALRWLTQEGLIEKNEAPSEGGRPRHVYAINDRGREALASWQREPTEPPPLRIELLLKLFFGAHADRSTNRAQILAYREQMVRDREHYRSIAEGLDREPTQTTDLPYWLLTLRFGEHDRTAHIAWCDEALAALEELPDLGNEGEDESREERNSKWQKSKRTGT
ncbi:MAG: PadR family transcriptional regulator [Deltaproteobacteria bacterium]|nr:PadR family transcriptional regulator [Deltaproteobacteria bacterium]